jgi:response regulator of citrate/malate metabolism
MNNEVTTNTEESKASKRGRPMQYIKWPESEFTFDNLRDTNVLSSSSLRKKMRMELAKGSLVKVNTLRTAFGRPKDLYKKLSCSV